MLTVWRGFLCGLLLIAVASCQANSVGKKFFKDGYAARVERLGTYPLEEQWSIFLYANQEVHPPLKDMALPIAKQGKSAVDYIFDQLVQPRHELDFRDSMVVFKRMQQGGYYDICGDEGAMETLRRNEGRISHPGWRDVYRQMLDDLCPESELEESGSRMKLRKPAGN